MNEVDNQVRATHKILRYDPIQKSFSALKYVIRAKDTRLLKITVAEHEFLLLEGSSAQGGATLAGSSSSHQAAEAEGVRAESEEQVADLDQFEDEFGVFDQVDLFEDPSGDLGDPSFTKADLLRTSYQAEMGFKRKPPTSLLDLIEGQLVKDAPGKSQPKLPPPPPIASTCLDQVIIHPIAAIVSTIQTSSFSLARRSKKEEGFQRQGARGWGEILLLSKGR